MRLEASAPLRADLAGGTLDIWPLYLLHPGAGTVNVALSLRARARYEAGGDAWELVAGDLGARRRVARGGVERALVAAPAGDPFGLVLRALAYAAPPGAGRISTRVEGPPGGGIGGSSALMIALLGLTARLAGSRLPRRGLAELARDLEAGVLGLPTGVQDYYPALYGGALWLRYGPGATRVERLPVDTAALESRLLLVFSGRAHSSAPSNWGLFRRRLEGEPLATRCFAAIADASDAAGRALARGDWRALGRAMDADWAARKRLDPALAPEDLRRLESAGRAAGALAAKCCGAASGGCLLFLVRRPEQRAGVEAAVRELGGEPLQFAVARTGLTVRRLDSLGAP